MDGQFLPALIITAVVLLPIIVIGIVLCCGKGADLIAGYNTASPEEKAKWNREALCRGTGVMVLSIVACILLSMAGAIWNLPALRWTGYGLLAAVTVGGLIYINKSKRFRKK